MEEQAPLRERLTKREREILKRLSAGLSDQQIAAELFLSSNTIRWYNHQIYSKLSVRSRTEAAVRARRLGLLDDADSPHAPPTPSHNLPVPTASFIGRDREIAEVKHLLQVGRLLTLTGVAGTGKTRLALRVAMDVLNDFPDGVYFVDLAPINHPAGVTKTIATVLDVFELPGEPLAATLKRALVQRDVLLLLDNFEQVMAAAPLVSDLLAASPGLRVMVTSREALRLSGEHEYSVPPLSLPPVEAPSLQTVSDSEAVSLFVQRVQQLLPRFTLNADNAQAIAEICRRLDGLPLAIELAAARCKLLPPQVLLTRLDSRLTVLAGGPRDAPARQRTLRATLEWSFELLDDDERTLFTRLAVFRGGCSLDAVEAVCGHDLSVDVLDGLASLLDKSLLQQEEIPVGEPRFLMLETIRVYAWECLETSGETDAVRWRHAQHFVELAERAEPELRIAPQIRWFQRFGLEQENIRAVLEWSLEGGDVSHGVRLASVLWLYWYAYGHHPEGQQWTQRLLVRLNEVSEEHHARFLIGAGHMAMTSDAGEAKRMFVRALDISRRRDDRLSTAWTLAHMAVRDIGGDEAMAVAEEALELFRALGYQPGIAYALNVVGEIARFRGEDTRARRAYEASLRICLETGEARRVAILYFNLAFLAQHEGDYAGALDATRQALRIARDMQNRGEVAWCLPIIAGSLAALGQPERAARLLGVSELFLERIGAFNMPADRQEFDRIRAQVTDVLGDAAFQSALADGRKMTLEQAVAEALEEPE